MKRILILFAVVLSGWLLAQTVDGFGPEELAVTAPVVAAGGGGGGATATDTFDRVFANPMSTSMSDGVSSWTDGPGGLSSCKIESNALWDVSGDNNGCVVASPSFAGDQEASVTVGNFIAHVGIILRYSSDNFYLLFLANSTSIQVYRSDGLSFTLLGSTITVSTVVQNDVLKFTASGSTLEVFVNGVSKGTRTDATYSTGQPGIRLSNTSAWVDEFTASDL